MIIIMSEAASEEQIGRVEALVRRRGLEAHRSLAGSCAVVTAGGDTARLEERELRTLGGVHRVIRTERPYRLAGRPVSPGGTVVELGGGLGIGGRELVVMAGPCAVESAGQIDTIAGEVARRGATVLRGGAFKPRTSPYSFQGLGEEGLRCLREAARRHKLRVVSEVMDPAAIGMVSEYVDLLQVGARNMQNFVLLKELGRARLPVLLKRGMAATIEEWLLAAEHIMAGGNERVVLCERGIRTFENATRNTLDLAGVAVVKRLSHLPVVVDPSHGTGLRDTVAPMALAALAAGADGLLVEVHNAPGEALSDGAQSITPEEFSDLVARIREMAPAVGRSLATGERATGPAGRRASAAGRGIG